MSRVDRIYVLIEKGYFQDGGLTMTSMCPTLGRKHSVITSGMCHSTLQDPKGKFLPVSVIGIPPYVLYNDKREWNGGAEFQIIDIYAKKFSFTPILIKAPAFDNEGGMVYSVRT